jgi:hypothetical protein
MILATIKISKTNAKVKEVSPITAGLVGAMVEVEFDSTWNGYNKVYVWSGNNRVITDTTASGIVPAEVVENQKSELKFGVYGTKDDDVTPTIWANLGFVRPSAEPSGDESADPSLPIWAQLQKQIEAMPDEVRGMIADYMASYDNGSTATIGTVELLSDNWVGGENLYSQVVSIDGVTENSQVDITPSVEQLVIFYEKDLTFVTENDGGVVTVYAIGQKPENDYTIQVTITEVKV